MTRYAIVADLNRCVGCQTCTAACKHANATAPGVQWRKVLDFETGEFPDVRRAFLPVGCMHCDEPPCMEVCPSTATRKRADGIVTIDYDICIGCAYCAVACPYQARFRVDAPSAAYGGAPMRHESLREDPARLGVAQKCTFCVDRIDAGLAAGLVPGVDESATPACVASCIAGALHFGDLDDADSNVSTLMRDNQNFRMHEGLGTGPNIYYLYDRGEGDEGGDALSAPMVAEPAGLAAVSPKAQANWDWRAAGNFTFGGTGTGLFGVAALGALFAPAPTFALWLAMFAGLGFVGLGLFCVWLEIGRPWRFLNVYRNPMTSWMSREALVALPFFALGLGAILVQSVALSLVAAAFGALFVYCQARILRASKGIPAWREARIQPLILATSVVEGLGLFSALLYGAGFEGGVRIIAPVLLGALALRFWFWRQYRGALSKGGAPSGALKVLDCAWSGMDARSLVLAGGLTLISLALPMVLPLAGLVSMISGWRFKFVLVTKAAFNQGFAINKMPARGAGTSAPGIQPGWKAG